MKTDEILYDKDGHLIAHNRHRRFHRAAVISLFFEEYQDQFNINKSLYEALEKSYAREEVEAKLEEIFKLQIHNNPKDPQNIRFVIRAIDKPDIGKILQFIHQQGWFVIAIDIDNVDFSGDDQQAISQLKTHQFKFAAMIIEATRNIEYKTPELIYHTTPLPVWLNKIKHYGLSPKSVSIIASHPERVYFTTTPELAIKLGKLMASEKLQVALQQTYDTKKFDPKQYYKTWAVLEINTKKIPNMRGLSYFRLHQDPNVDTTGKHMGLYSQNYVPPQAIRIIKQFDVKF